MSTRFTSVVRAKVLSLFLVAVLLVGGGCTHRNKSGPPPSGIEGVSPGFSYPPARQKVQVEAPYRTKSLSGVVVDPSGAAVVGVLIELTDKEWNDRLAATMTGKAGRFKLSANGPGRYNLKISYPEFDTLLIVAIVSHDAETDLEIEMLPSS